MTVHSPSAYAMCGLAFSGKTTIARRIAHELNIERISLDDINVERGLDGGGDMTDRQWEETSFMAMARLDSLLRKGCSAVVDDTFSHRFLRDRFRGVAEALGCRFAVLFVDTPLSTIDARRAENRHTLRRAGIRDDVFMRHRDRFQYPAADEAVVRLSHERDLEDWLRRERARMVQ